MSINILQINESSLNICKHIFSICHQQRMMKKCFNQNISVTTKAAFNVMGGTVKEKKPKCSGKILLPF